MPAPVVEAEPEIAELLRACAIFDGLADDQLAHIAALLQPVHFEPGQTIVAERELADRWFLIADGTAAVVHSDLIGQEVTLAVLGPGDSFGERALVGHLQPRSATIKALTMLEALALDGAHFQQSKVNATPLFADRLRQRLDAMAIDTALKRASPFASLPHDALRSLANQLIPQHAERGDMVVRQGETGDCMYLIRSGSVEVIRRKRRVSVLREGDSFGEVTLLTAAARTATIRALEETELLVLGREAFQTVAREHAAVAAHFRELVGARFRGAAGQPLLVPDPLTTIMPLVGIRRRKRYWMVLLIGTLMFALLTVAAQLGGTYSAVYAVMVVGALVGPVVFVQYLAESNILTERPFELIATGVLAAAVGLPPAIWLQREAGILPGTFQSAMLIAAIEEPAKLLGVVWLLRLPALRFRMDGVIFGAAAGMGFAALETGMYALARIETVGVLVGVLWFRALLSPFTHGTWTAIACATLWRERAAGWRNGGWKIAAALAAAILLHGLWDWPALPLPLNFVWLAAVGVASVLGLRLIVHHAADEEARSVAALVPEMARATPKVEAVRCGGCGRYAPAGAHYCPRCGLALRRLDQATRLRI